MSARFYTNFSFALALLCWLAYGAQAQRTPFYNLNVENGLIQSQVTAITQDNSGHLWIGTLGGLARFDGSNFANFTIRDGMPENEVTSLAVDKSGKIWIGNPGSISSFDGKTFRKYTIPGGAPNAGISRIQVDENNKVWFIKGLKVYSLDKGKLTPLNVPGIDSAVAVLPVKDGVWVARVDDCIYHLHGNKWDSLAMPRTADGRRSYPIDIYRSASGNIWVTATSGLMRVENNRLVPYMANNKPVNFQAPYRSITEDTKGNIWLGAYAGGVLRVSGQTIQYYNKQTGLSDNITSKLFTDAEGNVWIGTDGQGLFRFSGAPFTVLDESMGLRSGQVRSLTGDKYGKLYLGTVDAGLYVYEGEKVKSLYLPSQTAVYTMAVTADNRVWMGTPSGLFSYYNQVFKAYAYPSYGFPPSGVNALYTDSRNRLWIGFNKKVMVRENDSFRSVAGLDVFVRSFLEIGSDSILVATNNEGMLLYHNGQVTPFITRTIADSSSILCLALRGKKELWIGTGDNGVVRYNLATGNHYMLNKSNGLRSDFIYNIIEDNSSNIWLGTGYGIHKISINAENNPVVKFYGKSQGVAGMESNHNAVYKMTDGSIWFGTTNGALRYQPQAQAIDTRPLSIVLQSVKVFGEHITDSSYYDSTEHWYKVPVGLHLPPKKNNITFTFQAISLSSGNEQIMYRYRIEGLEAPWSDWSPTNSVTFSALPPGKYVLHVESNTGGELHYPFEIITPFHKTGWFRLLILAGCILLGITLQYIANRVKQNRLKLIERTRREEQARVRQRTAEDFHDEVGNKLTRINVLANVLKNKIPQTPETQRIIAQIEDNTAQLYSGTKDILWSLKPSNDSLYEILHRIRDFGGELFQDTDIDFVFLGTDMRWKNYKMPMDVSRNLIMIFKEALNNTLKYSKATTVQLDIRIKMRNVLQLTLKDNGQGFDMQHTKKGHGIDNMHVRAKRIQGRFYIDSRPGKGTIINLAFRLPPKETKSEKKRRIEEI
ncbi:MAG: hypothetical protein JNL72_11695 [Flavipsychrobacter sp.]|nr:hypothetical protein [Flavipsychrobacter sp.]